MSYIKYEVRVHGSGNKSWYLNGKCHREGGPAVECANGTKHWYLNGECHREDGPAVECANGTKHWYLNNKHHREDGPAVEYADGGKSWYLNDKYLTEDEFNAKMNAKNSPQDCSDRVIEIDGVKYVLKKKN